MFQNKGLENELLLLRIQLAEAYVFLHTIMLTFHYNIGIICKTISVMRSCVGSMDEYECYTFYYTANTILHLDVSPQ